MIRAISVFISAFAFVTSAAAQPPEKFVGREIHDDAPTEVHQWGSLIGDWDVRWESYDENGNAKNNGAASWHWYSTLDGFAIVDFYTHEMPEQHGRDRVGVNLRVFDPHEKTWHIRWSHNFGTGYQEFSAVHEGDEIVMYEVGKETVSRIRFFGFQENSFRQQEEKSDDGGETWQSGFKAWAVRQTD